MRHRVAGAVAVVLAVLCAAPGTGLGASRGPGPGSAAASVADEVDTATCESILSSARVEAALGSPVIASSVFDNGGVVPPLIHITCSYTLEDQRRIDLEVSDLVGPKGAPPFLIEKFASGTPVAGLGRKAYAGWSNGSGVAWSQGLPGIDRTLILTGTASLDELVALARGQWNRASAAGNRPPVAKDDAYRVPAGGTLVVKKPGVLKNDRDPDGDKLTASLGRHTTLARATRLGKDGSLRIDFPDGWSGRACLEYTVSDPKGAISEPALIRVTIGKPKASVIADACDLISEDADQAAKPPPLKARARINWYVSWWIRGPHGMYRFYQGLCRREWPPGSGRRGWLGMRFGYWTTTYLCWRYTYA